MVRCSSCGEMQTKKNYSRHLKRRYSGGIEDVCDAVMENFSSVQSPAAVVATRARLTSADSGIVSSEPDTVTPPQASYRSAQPLTYRYKPAGPSVMLMAAILGAVPKILDQHDRYSQAQLVYYLQTYFPEIPEQLRAPMVLAAAAGAKQASLLHNVYEKNM